MPTTQEQFDIRHRQILVLQQKIQQNRQKLKQQSQQQKKKDLEYDIQVHSDRIASLKKMLQKLETKLKQTGKTQQDLKKHADDVAIKFWVRELVSAEKSKDKVEKQLGQLTQQRNQIIQYYQKQDVPQAIQINRKIDFNNEILKISLRRHKYAHGKLGQRLSEQKIQQAVKQYKASN